MGEPASASLAALAHVRERAERTRTKDIARIERVLAASGVAANVGDLCAGVGRIGVVTINFHPDRIAGDGRSVADSLLADGVYRSQFETRISNGGLTAFPGGERDRWEERLFGGAYQVDGANLAERPRYGALDLFGLANGASPRFGSCHLRLKKAAIDRSTFFVGDSAWDPEDGAVSDRLEPLIAGLLEHIARGDDFGRPLTVSSFVGRLLGREPVWSPATSHALDACIETQTHGSLALASDVEEIVIDSSFRSTPTGVTLSALAERYRLRAGWHAGSQLAVTEIPLVVPPGERRRWRDFCGEGRAAALARRVAGRFGDGRNLDAATLGRAAVSVVADPAAWQPWHDTEDAPTRLKDLWHILVVYGRPVSVA